ncbi:hypothetical protein A5320_00595 [Rheinheimera sp. SA_1]|uniref:LytTR family DNA-binding domain-containing protein n=1 Tax=Rheinheimera sp. SA_1 TaxID=1827365 RepID=UPI0007FBDD5D|nr:LytTR family DNA-binding domain-containing protein [Rheinheimera sp. SA_1]OBP15973.1 hypothetical protein A5320_00595 [Rheinheimera sp. SA_1]
MLVADFAKNEMDPKIYFYSIGFILALLFALLDSNPQALALPQLLGIWLFQGLAPVSLLMFCQQWLQKIALLQQGSPWVKLLCCGIFASVLFAGPALLVDVWMGLNPHYYRWESWLEAWLTEIVAIAPMVTIGWLAANAPWLLGWRMIRAVPASVMTGNAPVTTTPFSSTAFTPPPFITTLGDHATEPPQNFGRQIALPDDDAFAGFQRQLPVDRRGHILYLKAELHYLLVVTTQGRALILSSLKDAVASLPANSGFQPHRSYWVNLAVVKKLTRQGRQGQLILYDGSKIPVSRQQLANVTELLQQRANE